MESSILTSRGHSAQVRMELRLNGHVLSVAQLGPDFLVVKEPVEHPPGEGEIYLRIDDAESSWRVRVVEGISTNRVKTRIERVR